MRKVLLTGIVFIFCSITALAQPGASFVELPFTDLDSDHEYFDSIQFLYYHNILEGDQDKQTFRPDDTLNRAEMTAILARVANVEPTATDYNDCFPDVTEGWFEPYICWAKAEGYVQGYNV